MAPRTVDNEWEIVKDSLTNEPLTLTLNVSNNWQQTISNLPTYGIQDNGLVTYDYRIRELKQGWKPDTIEDSILDANEKYDGHYTVSSYDEDGSTLTVTNTLTHMDIIAVKAWKPEGLHGNYAEVTFTLQSRVVGSGDDAWKDVADADGKPVSKKLTGEEDPAWTVTWTELPRTENGQTLEYRVVEKLADGLKEEEHVQFSITPETISSESADKTFTFTVTNIPLGQITVTKKGEDGGLPNVEFTLTGNDGKSYKRTTSADGTATFTGLPLYDSNGTEITYTLKETSTPDGYIQLTEPIEVSFTAETKPEGVVYWATDSGYLLHAVEYEVVNGIRNYAAGGDSLSLGAEQTVNQFLKAHGVEFPLAKGYGMTEVSSAATIAAGNVTKPGSVGIPMVNTVVSIFEPGTETELPIGQRGEICICTPTAMKGYYNKPEETAYLLRRHADGQLWAHTGDIGSMDEDGFVYLDARIKRIIIRHDGFKVFPSMIENVISRHPAVHQCCVVGCADTDHTQGRLPFVFVVLEPAATGKKRQILRELRQLCLEELPEYVQPAASAYKIIPEMPLTPAGKADYRKLEEEVG